MGKKRGKCVKPLQNVSGRLDKESCLRATRAILLTNSDSGHFALIGNESNTRCYLINSSAFKPHFYGHTEPTVPVINQKTSLQGQSLLFLILRHHDTSLPLSPQLPLHGTHCRPFPQQSIVNQCDTILCLFCYSVLSLSKLDSFFLRTAHPSLKA